ncbi:MAG: hypothetical protein R2941_24650 [Desulfobacterales bacterium]
MNVFDPCAEWDYESTAKGDINTVAGLDLGDAILALQLCSGINGLTVNMAGEVNGDSRIGQEEAIYVLRKLSQ